MNTNPLPATGFTPFDKVSEQLIIALDALKSAEYTTRHSVVEEIKQYNVRIKQLEEENARLMEENRRLHHVDNSLRNKTDDYNSLMTSYKLLEVENKRMVGNVNNNNAVMDIGDVNLLRGQVQSLETALQRVSGERDALERELKKVRDSVSGGVNKTTNNNTTIINVGSGTSPEMLSSIVGVAGSNNSQTPLLTNSATNASDGPIPTAIPGFIFNSSMNQRSDTPSQQPPVYTFNISDSRTRNYDGNGAITNESRSQNITLTSQSNEYLQSLLLSSGLGRRYVMNADRETLEKEVRKLALTNN